MTKKDYVLIARCISGATIPSQPMAEFMRGNIAQRLAHELASENPRFDRARFLAACGVQS